MAVRCLLAVCFWLGLIAPVGAQLAAAEPVCRATDHGRDMDFWIGRWRVVDPATFVELGRNSISISLDGCAIEEKWVGADGTKSASLYYFVAKDAVWKQVWLTADTAQLGGLKLRSQIRGYEGKGVRFTGMLKGVAGEQILDRSTINSLGDGRVRHLIEQSTNGGTSWKILFDAYYLPLP